MTYEHDGQAAEEAARHTLGGERLDWLRERVAAKRVKLGADGVRGHRVEFGDKWGDAIPTALRSGTSVSRGDVFDLAATGDWMAVFAASFIWGTGRVGYGPHRYREIVEGTNGHLNEMLTAAVEVARDEVIAGYARLYGGYDPKSRLTANSDGCSRIDNFGPAFFTKFLYFTSPGAVILDNVLARRVHDLAHVPYLVSARGRSVQWSPYRYAVYLKWMHQTAQLISAEPDELELTLFTIPAGGG